MKSAYELLTDDNILKAKPGIHDDGNGLFLEVSAKGVKSWKSRYTVKNLAGGKGKADSQGLGKLGIVDAKTARERNVNNQNLARQGTNPKSLSAVGIAALAGNGPKPTFGALALELHADLKLTWKNPEKQGNRWLGTMKKHCAQIWELPVDTITTDMIKKLVLDPIWHSMVPTAQMVAANLNVIFRSAASRKFCAENVADREQHIKAVMRKQKDTSENHKAMDWEDVPAFFAEVAQDNCMSAKALLVTILTAVRSCESLGTDIKELSDDRSLWNVPWSRMKKNHKKTILTEAHPVPLSTQAQAIIASIPRPTYDEGVLFYNDELQQLSDEAMLRYLQRRHPDLTVHGFRTSFNSWCDNAPGNDFNQRAVDYCLCHIKGSDTDKAYMKGGFVEKRTKILQAWADYCTSAMPKAIAAPVLQITYLQAAE